jgi:hypothetical protein
MAAPRDDLRDVSLAARVERTEYFWAWWLPEPQFVYPDGPPERPPFLSRTIDANGVLFFKLIKAVGCVGYEQSRDEFFRIAEGSITVTTDAYYNTPRL